MSSLLASMSRSEVQMKPESRPASMAEPEAEEYDKEMPVAVAEPEPESAVSKKTYMEMFCSNERSELPEIDVHTGRAPKLSKILLDYSNTCLIRYVCDCAEVTMSSFINAVLRDHFKQHKKVLRKLHRREINFSAL